MADLNALINAIPTASDGGIITPDYHNTMLAAVKQMASQLGTTTGGGSSGTTTSNLQPVMLPLDGYSAWTQGPGYAKATVTGCYYGWFPLYLPQGATLTTLSSKGVIGSNGYIAVDLYRQDLSNPTNTESPLVVLSISTSVAGQDGSFSVPGPVDSTRAVVDNNRFFYYLVAIGSLSETTTTASADRALATAAPAPEFHSELAENMSRYARKGVAINAQSGLVAGISANAMNALKSGNLTTRRTVSEALRTSLAVPTATTTDVASITTMSIYNFQLQYSIGG